MLMSLWARPFWQAVKCRGWLHLVVLFQCAEKNPLCVDSDIIWQKPRATEVFNADLYSQIITMKIFGLRKNINEFCTFSFIGNNKGAQMFLKHVLVSFLVKRLGQLSYSIINLTLQDFFFIFYLPHALWTGQFVSLRLWQQKPFE